MSNIFDKLPRVEARFLELENLLSNPEVVRDRDAYQRYGQEHAELNPVVRAFRVHTQILSDLEDSRELLEDGDPEMKDLAKDEIEALTEKKAECESELKKLLIPKDPNDVRNVIIEIRAGTGGEEAGLLSVGARVREELARDPDKAVVIVADGRSRNAVLVDLIDECKLAGARKISLAAERE